MNFLEHLKKCEEARKHYRNMSTDNKKQYIINWAHFYIWNINHNGDPEYTLHRIAQLSGVTEGTIGKCVRRIRRGEL